MKVAILLLLLSGSPDAGHSHCWHFSAAQHAVPCHADSVCCICGEPRCVHLEGCSFGPPLGHGPFAPSGFTILDPDAMSGFTTDGGARAR